MSSDDLEEINENIEYIKEILDQNTDLVQNAIEYYNKDRDWTEKTEITQLEDLFKEYNLEISKNTKVENIGETEKLSLQE